MKTFIFALALGFVGVANANHGIDQRINDCERNNGAGGCVYDILRELADVSAPSRLQEGEYVDEREVHVQMSWTDNDTLLMAWPSSGDTANGEYNCTSAEDGSVSCPHHEKPYTILIDSSRSFQWTFGNRVHTFNKLTQNFSSSVKTVGGI